MAALRPLTAARTIALLGQSRITCWRQRNERSNCI